MRQAIITAALVIGVSILIAFAGCSTSSPANCGTPGEHCSIDDASVGVCTGTWGCVDACSGFLDPNSCVFGSACYPVYRDKFGCLGNPGNQRQYGQSCRNEYPNDCISGAVCINRICMMGCTDDIDCGAGGPPCEDVEYWGWKVCNLKHD